MFFATFVCGTLLFVLFVFHDWFGRPGKLIRKIPGPKAWPVIGNSMNYAVTAEKLFPLMRSLQKKYGYINQIHGMKARMVNISNPEDIEKILSSAQYNLKKDPYKFIVPWLTDGLLVSSGNKWLQRRKMLTKSFHFNVLKKFTETFKTSSTEFLKTVEKEVDKEKTDVLALISPTTLRIMCETSMGLSMEDTPAMIKYFKSILEIGQCFAVRMSKLWLHNEFLFNVSDLAKKQEKIINQLHEFTNRVISDRRKLLENLNLKQVDNDTYETREKLAMLDLLIENEKSGLLNNEGIREEVDTFMFEGFDTTSLSLTYMILAIANEPDVQNKIFEEMLQIFGDSDRMPSNDDLNEMKYLECCIKETLRLYPAAPVIARHLMQDTVLSGYTVPANTDCYLFIFDLHRRADLYPDPDRFNPDRFLPENSKSRNPYSYVPFSAGQRNCIGQKFAMLEMKVVMSSLLRKYRLEAVTKVSDVRFQFDMVLRSAHPIYVRFRSRQ